MAIPQDIRALMRDELAEFEPYDGALVPCEIALAANENNFGIPFTLEQELAETLAKVPLNRYPDPMSNSLRDLLAAELGLRRENICVGNGGDELIFNLLLAFGGRGTTVLDLPPSFSVYGLYARMLGTELVEVPRDPQTFDIDVDAVAARAATADIVLLTSPNNPTGNLISRDDVARICEAARGIVLLDEAYIDFAPPGSSGVDLLERFERLVVLRTFSKAYALAGGRCGYIISSPGVVEALAAVRQPYSVNRLTQAAAELAVRKREQFAPFIDMIVSERARLTDALAAIEGVDPLPSWANFVFVRVPDAAKVYRCLLEEHSILVRDFSGKPLCEDCLRITVGKPVENDMLVKAMTQILEEER